MKRAALAIVSVWSSSMRSRLLTVKSHGDISRLATDMEEFAHHAVALGRRGVSPIISDVPLLPILGIRIEPNMDEALMMQ